MPGEILYLDSSALVKLVVRERESSALVATLSQYRYHVSSAIAAVEVQRAVRRASASERDRNRATQVIASLNLLTLDERLLVDAAEAPPDSLRTLDALHLVSALSLGDDLAAMVVYDVRLSAAAILAGLPVLTPE